MTADTLEPCLFATEPALVTRALAAGISSFVVDWERSDKHRRQAGFDTEINSDSPEDIVRLAALGVPTRICRVNRAGESLEREVDTAVASGATDILLPMVEHPAEVEALLRAVNGRARPGILVETAAACARARGLASFPLARVYVGLNDLAISRGSRSIFAPLIDGTLDELRSAFFHHAFGFGGLTLIDGGAPLACRRLLEEMARLECSFAFLRRSFRRDAARADMQLEVSRLRSAFDELRQRDVRARERDRALLTAQVSPLVEVCA